MLPRCWGSAIPLVAVGTCLALLIRQPPSSATGAIRAPPAFPGGAPCASVSKHLGAPRASLSAPLATLSRTVSRRAPNLERLRVSARGVPFQCNPKMKGEKMTFGWVDKEYLDQTIAKIEEGSSEHLILDIREPHELDYGTIPYSMNVPASELETALDLSPKDWEMRYGFPKPKAEDEIVVYGEPRPGSTYDPDLQQRLISIAAMLSNEYGYKLVQRYSQSFFNYFNDPNMIY